MAYLDMSTVEARRMTELPKGSRTRDYGSRIATYHMLKVSGRWHRVYMVCWSNAGTAYIRKGNENHYIATGEL